MKKVVNEEFTEHSFEDYILFDIETTGLNRTKDYMYMFGICERVNKKLIYSQYYIEDKKDEFELILKINELLKEKNVISYNGDRFDFHFIRKRAYLNGIELERIYNRDIYREFQKLNFFLNEPNLKAISIGQRLGLDVHDHITQKESVKIFSMYEKIKNNELLKKLIYHNYIDLMVLSRIYEYKISILEKILHIKNKNFNGIIENIYLQQNNLVLKLKSQNKDIFEYNFMNYLISKKENIIEIVLNLEYGFIDKENKGYTFKLDKISNTNFKFSKNLKENRILLIKDDKLIRENLLLLLNVL